MVLINDDIEDFLKTSKYLEDIIKKSKFLIVNSDLERNSSIIDLEGKAIIPDLERKATISILESETGISDLEEKTNILNKKNNTEIKTSELITYGLNQKATITMSSIKTENILICVQKNFKNYYGNIVEEQEVNVEITKNNLKKISNSMAIFTILTIFGEILKKI